MSLLCHVNEFYLPSELFLVTALSRRQIKKKKDTEISAIINKPDLISTWRFWEKD